MHKRESSNDNRSDEEEKKGGYIMGDDCIDEEIFKDGNFRVSSTPTDSFDNLLFEDKHAAVYFEGVSKLMIKKLIKALQEYEAKK